MPYRFTIASLLTSAGVVSALAAAPGCSASVIPIGETGNGSTDAGNDGGGGFCCADGGEGLGTPNDGGTSFSDSGFPGDGSSSAATDVITGLPTLPALMASDGTTLYLLDEQTLTVSTVPVTGGAALTSIYAKSAERTLLQADSTGVYILGGEALLHVPTGGGTPTTISDGSGIVVAATVTGQSAYWVQAPQGQEGQATDTIKSAPLGGGASTTLGEIGNVIANQGLLAVGTTTGFFAGFAQPALIFPLTGVADGGYPLVATGDVQCNWLHSVPGSADAYCVSLSGGPVEAIHPDGTSTTLATSYYPHDAVTDSTYLYWSDTPAPGGVIMKVPLAGGAATVVANESATALAVDDTAIYWATTTGTIRRLRK